MENGKTVCHRCGHTVSKGNFSSNCSVKMVEECDCWVKDKKYNCGHKNVMAIS